MTSVSHQCICSSLMSLVYFRFQNCELATTLCSVIKVKVYQRERTVCCLTLIQLSPYSLILSKFEACSLQCLQLTHLVSILGQLPRGLWTHPKMKNMAGDTFVLNRWGRMPVDKRTTSHCLDWRSTAQSLACVKISLVRNL